MTPLEQMIVLAMKLDIAQVEYGNESEQADAIRDLMDGPWHKLTEDDKKRMDEFYVVLNSFNLPDKDDAKQHQVPEKADRRGPEEAGSSGHP